ncbi:DUF128 domain-containing protein [Chloroflexota bacterium]
MEILRESPEPMGATLIARQLKSRGVELGERAVRYHLKIMDERGLTQLMGQRDGRVLTERGVEEVSNALVKDKVGFAISRIAQLAFRTDFNPDTLTGLIPVNLSLFPKESFSKAIRVMKPAFTTGLCISDLVAVAHEGERFGELVIPPNKVGLATICSIVINGTLLKLGVPMDSKFSGILQIRNNKPLRFVELIHYAGCSLDPSEVFIRAKMTSVAEVIRTGEGKILTTYREIPALCKPIVEEVVAKLKKVGIEGLLVMGNTSETVCEIPVELNRIGIILLNGLNPVAAAVEAGIEVDNYGMSMVIDYDKLVRFKEIMKED